MVAEAAPVQRTPLPIQRSLRRGVAAAVQYVPALLLLAGLVAVWELLVQLLDARPWILPAPSGIWNAFMDTRGLLPAHIRTTGLEAVVGLAVAATVGIALAVAISSVALVRLVLYPIVVVSQTIPMIVLAPLLVIWLGFGMTPKVVVVALVGFFPIVVSTVDGLDGADREMVALVRSMGASKLDELRHILIPSAIPAFFAGLKIGGCLRSHWRRHRRVGGRERRAGYLHHALASVLPHGPDLRRDRRDRTAQHRPLRGGAPAREARLALEIRRTRRGHELMTRYGTRFLLMGLAVLAMGLIAAACGDDDDGDELRSITMMLEWTPNTNHAGIYIAAAKGWYEDAGLDVEIIEPAAGGVEQVVGAGRAHFGISVQENVIPARAQDVPIVSVAAIIEHNTSSLIALGDEGITRPRDLEGKTYGGFGGALETALVSTLVECDGGGPRRRHLRRGRQRRLPRRDGAEPLRLRLDLRWLGRGALHAGAERGHHFHPLH